MTKIKKGTICGYFIGSGKIKEDLISVLKANKILFEEVGDYILIKPKKPKFLGKGLLKLK